MRILAFLFLLAAAGCNDNNAAPDMGLLSAGAECLNGIGGTVGTCAPGLACCTVPCVYGPRDGGGGCLDLPSQCQRQPAPSGYGPCF